MTGAIDVCGAMEILLQKEKSYIFGSILSEASLVVAPDLYVPELANTLWKYCKAGVFDREECVQYIKDGMSFVDKFIGSGELWQEAFFEGVGAGHSVYDMLYMVAARRNGAVLITNDAVLARICGDCNVRVCF